MRLPFQTGRRYCHWSRSLLHLAKAIIFKIGFTLALSYKVFEAANAASNCPYGVVQAGKRIMSAVIYLVENPVMASAHDRCHHTDALVIPAMLSVVLFHPAHAFSRCHGLIAQFITGTCCAAHSPAPRLMSF